MFSAGLTLGLLFLSVTGQVPHRAAFDYAGHEGPQTCASTEEIQHAVTERLGYSPWVEDPEVIINAVVSGGPGAFTLHLAMVDANGEIVGQRDLVSSSEDCREISQAMILDLCMAIDPQAALRPVPPTVEPVVLPRPRRPPPAWRASAPPPRSRSIPWGTSAWVASALSVGTSPNVAGGLRAGGALHWGVLASGLEVGAGWPAMAPVKGGSVGTQLTTATWLPCVQQDWFQVCTTFTVGSVTALAEGLQQARSVTRPYVAVGTRVGLVVPVLPWLDLRTGLDGAVPLNRIRLTDSTTGSAYWSMPPGNLSGFMGLGASWR